ncbi:MAG: carbonic anhydrase [Alphaproteobacteria bacterium]|jgi:carbonic anhydrase|nr:carbonic anhydrase [Alphaproteobacteria bacterium]MCV6599706.1 carbonic anhydrase [Alphaproteobacteria bacterium]
MSINKLIKGYQNFYKDYNESEEHLLKRLENAQNPSTVIVACSDSRVDPALITNANYGDIFVIRNVANIIPPCENDYSTHHGTSSALEYAVRNLKVDNLIVMGHSNCGGIKALMDTDLSNGADSFIEDWIDLMKDVKARVPKDLSYEEQLSYCEKEGIKQSLQNALSFDFVQKRHDKGELKVLGWYFDLTSGKMLQYDAHKDTFIDLSSEDHQI